MGSPLYLCRVCTYQIKKPPMPVTHAIRRAFIHDMRLSSFSQSCSIITPWRASLVSSARNLSACSFRRHSVLSSNSNRPPPVCVYFSLRCFHHAYAVTPNTPMTIGRIKNANQHHPAVVCCMCNPPRVHIYFSFRCFHNSKNAIPIKPIPTSIINAGQYQSCSGPQGGGSVNIHVFIFLTPHHIILNKSGCQGFSH